MTGKKACPLCGTECDINSSSTFNYNTIVCPVCGEYNLADRAKHYLNNRKDNLYIISGVTRNFYETQDKEGALFGITNKMIMDDATFQAEFISKSPKSVLEKTSLLLQYIARNSKHPGHEILVAFNDYPICFCKNAEELTFHLRGLEDIGDIMRLHRVIEGYTLFLTAKGWQRVENLNKPNMESKQAFVAMWFNEQMDEPFEKGILPLEDKNETGFKMLRIDQKHFNDKICDHIIAEIKQSRFMIADCTELRSAVFFEAGYAMGMGLPVVFTCREGTDIKKCFDTDHYNHIVWKDADDLKNKLRDRILATIGKAH